MICNNRVNGVSRLAIRQPHPGLFYVRNSGAIFYPPTCTRPSKCTVEVVKPIRANLTRRVALSYALRILSFPDFLFDTGAGLDLPNAIQVVSISMQVRIILKLLLAGQVYCYSKMCISSWHQAPAASILGGTAQMN